MAGRSRRGSNAGEAHFLKSYQAMQPRLQNRKLGLSYFAFNVIGDVGAWLHGRQNNPRRHVPFEHHRSALNQVDRLNALDDIRA